MGEVILYVDEAAAFYAGEVKETLNLVISLSEY